MRAAWLVMLGACGRLGFGAAGDAARGDGNVTRDVPAGDGDAAAVTNCTATLVCDTFDGTMLDPRWMDDSVSGTVTLDPSRAYRGSSSLHLHVDQITTSTLDPRADVTTNQGLPITGTIYTRAWMYFASPMPTSPFAQLINFANQAGQGLSMGERNGVVTNNDYTSGGYMESATVALPLDRWTCLQFEAPSGTTGTVRVFVDGSEVTDIALPVSSPQPAPDHTYLGVEWVNTLSSQPAFDAWLDEVIISASPTTCAQ